MMEREFLIGMAVTQFNIQYGRKIDPKLCNIRSIHKSYGCTHGYEIKSIREDDDLRLRIYFNIGDSDVFEPYRLEVDRSFIKSALGDEVYVMLGSIDAKYIESGIYYFRPLSELANPDNYALFVEGDLFEFMSGEKLSWVD